MSCCDICDELAQIKAEQAWEREALTLLLLHAGLQVPGTTPASNYWNPLDKAAAITLTNSDKTANSDGSLVSVRSITSHTSGKHYAEFEVTVPTGFDGMLIGIMSASGDVNDEMVASGEGVGFDAFAEIVQGFTFTPYGNNLADGDVVGVMDDIDNNIIYISINNVWQNSADPDAGTGGHAYSAMSGAHYLATTPGENSDTLITVRTASADFTGTKPAVASAWG